MERNLDLCHRILRYAKEHCVVKLNPESLVFGPKEAELFQATGEEITYHCLLLQDAGLIDATIETTALSIHRLTWQGHEYLDRLEAGQAD